MKTISNCSTCQAELKTGLIKSNGLLPDYKVKTINLYSSSPKKEYCNKCGKSLYDKYYHRLEMEKNKLNNDMLNLFKAMPIITTHSPYGWEYEVIDIVTGQSTTGTGVISEFTSSITDVFGMQANRYNKKLKLGEEFCKTQLRQQAINMGANAIIATDIDYSELGSLKGMIMVCMSGTAIKLRNSDVLGVGRQKKLDELISKYKRAVKIGYIYNERIQKER